MKYKFNSFMIGLVTTFGALSSSANMMLMGGSDLLPMQNFLTGLQQAEVTLEERACIREEWILIEDDFAYTFATRVRRQLSPILAGIQDLSHAAGISPPRYVDSQIATLRQLSGSRSLVIRRALTDGINFQSADLIVRGLQQIITSTAQRFPTLTATQRENARSLEALIRDLSHLIAAKRQSYAHDLARADAQIRRTEREIRESDARECASSRYQVRFNILNRPSDDTPTDFATEADLDHYVRSNGLYRNPEDNNIYRLPKTQRLPQDEPLANQDCRQINQALSQRHQTLRARIETQFQRAIDRLSTIYNSLSDEQKSLLRSAIDRYHQDQESEAYRLDRDNTAYETHVRLSESVEHILGENLRQLVENPDDLQCHPGSHRENRYGHYIGPVCISDGADRSQDADASVPARLHLYYSYGGSDHISVQLNSAEEGPTDRPMLAGELSFNLVDGTSSISHRTATFIKDRDNEYGEERIRFESLDDETTFRTMELMRLGEYDRCGPNGTL